MAYGTVQKKQRAVVQCQGWFPHLHCRWHQLTDDHLVPECLVVTIRVTSGRLDDDGLAIEGLS